MFVSLSTTVAVDGEARRAFDAIVDTQLLGDTPRWAHVAIGDSPVDGAELVVRGTPMTLPDLAGSDDAGDAGVRPWSDVPHPPTADDGPVMVLHLIRFHEAPAAAATPEDMATYTKHAAVVAGRHGGRIATWLAIDEVLADPSGRTWHQARFNAFPSREAFMAVVFDPDRLDAQRDHREVAIADTYTMILRPSVDQLDYPR